MEHKCHSGWAQISLMHITLCPPQAGVYDLQSMSKTALLTFLIHMIWDAPKRTDSLTEHKRNSMFSKTMNNTN